jgi:hypothetical protein
MLATKIYSVLVNSMADEQTGSKFTWFNSALRGSQNVQTLTNMIQVGQWYGIHMVCLLAFIYLRKYDCIDSSTAPARKRTAENLAKTLTWDSVT